MTSLKRSIGLYGLTMVAIGSCIGSGIFLTPAQIAGHLPTPFLILLVWGIGGLITLTGALTFAELGAMYPEAGGVYVFLKEAYGDLFGFLYGWAYLLIITSGAIAALAIAFATYLGFLLPLNHTGVQVVAVLVVIAVTVVNVLRVKAAEIFSDIFTGLKLLAVAAIVVIGLLWGDAHRLGGGQIEKVSSDSILGSLGLALIGVLWSYGGWQHASFLAGEARDPQRTVPRAMILGSLIVAASYLLINLGYMFLLPVEKMVQSGSVAADAISTVIPYGGKLVAVMIAISVLGTAGIYTLSAPRIYYAMARDGLFFKKMAVVHRRFKSPANAIVIQSAWAIILLLFWGTFEDVITYVVFTDWIFFGLTAVSIFVFRQKLSKKERPYKTFGYPVTPIIFIVIVGLFVLNTLIEKPKHAWAGLIFLALGLGVFLFFKKRGEKSNTGQGERP